MKRTTHMVSLVAVVWLGLGVSAAKATQIFDVTLDTSSINGGTFSLVFDLIDGDGFGNNTVTASGFLFGGGAPAGMPTSIGGASGDLGSTVTLTDTTFFNELVQDFTAGSSLSFTLDLTDDLAGGFFPDNFSFLLLDAMGNPLATNDPFGTNTFLTVDLRDPLEVRTFRSANIPAPSVQAVPEPATGVLLATGLMGAYGLRHRRRRGAGSGRPSTG